MEQGLAFETSSRFSYSGNVLLFIQTEDLLLCTHGPIASQFVLYGEQIQKNEMDGTCRTHRRDGKYVQNFSILEHVNGRDNFEVLGLDERIILYIILL
jgi:hypothetical protein